MAEVKPSVAQVRFRALTEEDGTRPYILVEQQYVPDLPVLRHGGLRLDLVDGIGIEEATRLAEDLNARVHALVYVGEDPDEKVEERKS